MTHNVTLQSKMSLCASDSYVQGASEVCVSVALGIVFLSEFHHGNLSGAANFSGSPGNKRV